MDRVPLLVAVSGPLTGSRYRVTAQGLVLGRAPTCDVAIRDQGVSREHARVMLHNAAVWVQDAGSRNGVSVNGKRITRHKQLSPGARLEIGVHAFTLELVPESEAPPPGRPVSSALDAAGLPDTVELDAPTPLSDSRLGEETVPGVAARWSSLPDEARPAGSASGGEPVAQAPPGRTLAVGAAVAVVLVGLAVWLVASAGS